jgi:hypothetical protein
MRLRQGGAAPGGDPGPERAGRDRPADAEALRQVAAGRRGGAPQQRVGDALGDHRMALGLGLAYQPLDLRAGATLGGQGGDQAAVELHAREGQLQQHVAGVVQAEVVQQHAEAGALQPFQRAPQQRGVAHDGAFGQFQQQVLRPEPRLGDDARQPRRKVGQQHHRQRHVEGQHQAGAAACRREIRQRPARDGLGELRAEPRALRHRDEGAGAERGLRPFPARQRLHQHRPAVTEAHDRLEAHGDLATIKAGGQRRGVTGGHRAGHPVAGQRRGQLRAFGRHAAQPGGRCLARAGDDDHLGAAERVTGGGQQSGAGGAAFQHQVARRIAGADKAGQRLAARHDMDGAGGLQQAGGVLRGGDHLRIGGDQHEAGLVRSAAPAAPDHRVRAP